MANSILKNKQIIWRCSNTMLAAIYETIIEIIKTKKMNVNSTISTFLEELNQDIHGDGCISIDISDYLKKRDDILIFAWLFKEAVEQIKKKFEWDEERYKHALKLYQLLTTSTD